MKNSVFHQGGVSEITHIKYVYIVTYILIHVHSIMQYYTMPFVRQYVVQSYYNAIMNTVVQWMEAT